MIALFDKKDIDYSESLNFNQIDSKKEEYSEDKLFRKFGKIGKTLKKSGAKVIYPAILLYLVLMESNTPWQVKCTIMGVLGYLISPIDCIPDAVAGLGLTDDFSALCMAISSVRTHITEVIKTDAKEIIVKWIPELKKDDFDNMDKLLRI